VRVLALFDPATGDLRGVLSARGDEPSGQVGRFFDPPDPYWETLARATLDQKVPAMSWDDFFEQLPDRLPHRAWWELVVLKATDLPSAFTELLAKSSR
jgi:hypothetical protein